ncbi:MAG: type II toxin-antitoxin system Phd/YefM family antitoxin [bacterium]|nr:type II toxin-antitoxin system Phd/YefM family antitoxin [bacterium]
MQATRFTEDVRPITDLKQRAAEIVDHARKTRRPVLLTRRGRGVAVLLDVEEFETLSDRAAFVTAVGEGAAAARAGDLHPNDEAMKILDSFGD